MPRSLIHRMPEAEPPHPRAVHNGWPADMDTQPLPGLYQPVVVKREPAENAYVRAYLL